MENRGFTNFGIARGNYCKRKYLLPTIEYERTHDGRNYLCFALWKWYFGLYWEEVKGE